MRDYLNNPVSREDLDIIVSAAKCAPRAGDFQITVIEDKTVIQEINDIALKIMQNSDNPFMRERASLPGYQPVYGAPVLVIFSAPEENIFADLTVACAAENMILTATNLGLGTCFMVSPTLPFTSPTKNDLSKKINLPEAYKPICAVAIGKSGEDKFTTPKIDQNNVNFI